MSKREDPDMKIAACAIAMTMRELQKYYMDSEIKKMFTRKRVDGMLKILNLKRTITNG